MKKKFVEVFNNQQEFHNTENISLYGTKWTTSRKRTYPATRKCYICNKTFGDTWCSTSVSPIVSTAPAQETLPLRCRVFKGFDPTALLHFSKLKLRTTLRSPQLECVTCQKRKAQTFTPIMADVPRGRLAFRLSPFSNTGIDYFGSSYVPIERSTEKRCWFHFTCPTTRAVLFEVVPSMDTSNCIMGIERFVALRDVPGVFGLTRSPTSLQLKRNSWTTFSTGTSRHILARWWGET